MIFEIATIIGITIIITTSKLLKPFREWATIKKEIFGELLSCCMCTGLWIGIIYYLSFEANYIKFIFSIFVKEIISYAALSSLLSEIIYLIMQRLKLK